jgi:hypothetical protein
MARDIPLASVLFACMACEEGCAQSIRISHQSIAHLALTYRDVRDTFVATVQKNSADQAGAWP